MSFKRVFRGSLEATTSGSLTGQNKVIVIFYLRQPYISFRRLTNKLIE